MGTQGDAAQHPLQHPDRRRRRRLLLRSASPPRSSGQTRCQPAAEARCAETRPRSWERQASPRPGRHPLPRPAPDPAAPPISSALRILVAEDNPVNQMVARQYLKNAGFAAVVVANGREAIAEIHRHPHELILMDVQMPEMDGLEATRRIRATQAAQEPGFDSPIHIVAMTANAMAGDREICLAAGMDDYVAKPLTPANVRALLDRYLPNPAAARPATVPADSPLSPPRS